MSPFSLSGFRYVYNNLALFTRSFEVFEITLKNFFGHLKCRVRIPSYRASLLDPFPQDLLPGS